VSSSGKTAITSQKKLLVTSTTNTQRLLMSQKPTSSPCLVQVAGCIDDIKNYILPGVIGDLVTGGTDNTKVETDKHLDSQNNSQILIITGILVLVQPIIRVQKEESRRVQSVLVSETSVLN